MVVKLALFLFTLSEFRNKMTNLNNEKNSI